VHVNLIRLTDTRSSGGVTHCVHTAVVYKQHIVVVGS